MKLKWKVITLILTVLISFVTYVVFLDVQDFNKNKEDVDTLLLEHTKDTLT